ncbi:hypothetical protein [Microterricola viridarii]|uniref:Uncharacterized protein n=1 Tax=Microterricola viridarii TaxID=412690 RepID=A0A1H1SZ18_9MICO|nr:hypothetical protein [Microterricola viridarii]SDS53073.1 hypothetical protein SAMN04489834_1651 [Microterricola viridarii]
MSAATSARERNIESVQSDEVEARGMQRLMEAEARLERWETTLEQLPVMSGSALAGDDIATPYEALSQQAISSFKVALDHLRTVTLVIVKTEAMPVLASFTLIRAALEAAGQALWLMGPTSRDERVLRSLQLSLEERRDLYAAEAEGTGSDTRLPADDKVLARLQELQSRRVGLNGRSLNVPTITKRLKQSDEYAGDQSISLLVAWKLASGMAHGRRSTMYHLLERQLVESTDTGFSVHMTSSIGIVEAFYSIAEQHLMKAVALFYMRNGLPMPFE